MNFSINESIIFDTFKNEARSDLEIISMYCDTFGNQTLFYAILFIIIFFISVEFFDNYKNFKLFGSMLGLSGIIILSVTYMFQFGNKILLYTLGIILLLDFYKLFKSLQNKNGNLRD